MVEIFGPQCVLNERASFFGPQRQWRLVLVAEWIICLLCFGCAVILKGQSWMAFLRACVCLVMLYCALLLKHSGEVKFYSSFHPVAAHCMGISKYASSLNSSLNKPLHEAFVRPVFSSCVRMTLPLRSLPKPVSRHYPTCPSLFFLPHSFTAIACSCYFSRLISLQGAAPSSFLWAGLCITVLGVELFSLH